MSPGFLEVARQCPAMSTFVPSPCSCYWVAFSSIDIVNKQQQRWWAQSFVHEYARHCTLKTDRSATCTQSCRCKLNSDQGFAIGLMYGHHNDEGTLTVHTSQTPLHHF